MKKLLLGATVVLVGAMAACSTAKVDVIRLEPRNPQPPMADMTRLAHAITSELERNHYNPPPINDSFSVRLFDMFLDLYDPYRLFLTDEDVQSFDKYRTFMDNELKGERLTFPWIVAELTSRRAEEFTLFAQRYLAANQFDLEQNREFVMGKRAVDSDAQRQLWADFLTNEVIRVNVLREMAKHPELKVEKMRKELPYMAKLSTERRVMLRVNQMTHPYRFPPQRVAAEKLLTALALTCDPHGIYSAPKDFERRMTQLNLTFAGIGVMYNMEDGVCQIMEVVKNGPVANQKADIHPNDIILAVAEEKGKPVQITGVPQNNVSDLIRGPKKSKVTFTVVPADDPDSIKYVTVVRDDIVSEEARASLSRQEITCKDGKKNIAMVKLPTFYQRPRGPKGEKRGCSDELRNFIIASEKENGKFDGLVLDLRNNGGGFLDEAIGMAGLFLPQGPVVQIRGRRNVQVLQCPDSQAFFTKPMVVLMNKNSASASEILAGVLKDYGRAVIIGDERTFGKGTVQQVRDLTPFASRLNLPNPTGGINLTTAKFYRVNGETTQCNGVPCDIFLPSSVNYSNSGEKYIPGALPFDVIPSAKYQRVPMDVAPHIKSLKKASEERIAQKDFFKVFKDKQVDSTLRNPFVLPEQKINLSFSHNWDKLVTELKNKQQQEAKKKTSPDATVTTAKDYVYVEDPYTDESLLILKELIERQN